MLVVLLGCHRERRPDARAFDLVAHRQQRLAEPISGFVLVPEGARLFASEDAARAASATPFEPATEHLHLAAGALQATELFAVVEDRGDVIEVSTLSQQERARHCVRRATPLMRAAKVRLFVRREALAPVLRRIYTETFEDGTAFSLAPGLPLSVYTRRSDAREGRADETVVVGAAHGIARPIDVAPSDVGVAFTDPSPFLEAASRKETKKLPEDTVLWVDDRPLLRVGELSPSLAFVRDDRNAGMNRTMVALSSTCVRIVARTLDLQIERSRIVTPKEDIESTTGRAPDTRLLGLRKGAALTWEGGAPAGEVIQEIWTNVAFEERGEQYCFSLDPALDTPVCVKRSSTALPEERDGGT